MTTAEHDELDYSTALAELDTILSELEAADVDGDRLAERVARACYDASEQVRYEARGANRFGGIRANLAAATEMRTASDPITRAQNAAEVPLQTALALTLVRRWLLPDVGLVLGVLLGNVFGVIILSWVLMPVLTRWLDGWLRR